MSECIEKGGRQARKVWIAAFGPIPDGLMVLHECDNEHCVNIAHLRLGTQRENMIDHWRRGRGSRRKFPAGSYTEPLTPSYGSRHPAAKLNEEAVRDIRSSDEPQAVLAARYHVSQAAISCARRYLSWRHVP